jgi:hypothetical protein
MLHFTTKLRQVRTYLMIGRVIASKSHTLANGSILTFRPPLNLPRQQGRLIRAAFRLPLCQRGGLGRGQEGANY